MRMWWNWGAIRAPPVAEEARRASGRGRQMRKALCRRRRCRAPQQEDPVSFCVFTIKYADVVELVDSLDLGSNAQACRFESCHPHQQEEGGTASLFLLVMGVRNRTYFNQTPRWGVAATSSKTGGFFNIIESCHPHHVGVNYASLAPTFFKSQSVLTALLLFGRDPLTLSVVYILFDRQVHSSAGTAHCVKPWDNRMECIWTSSIPVQSCQNENDLPW